MPRVCGFRTTDRYDSFPNPQSSSPFILLKTAQLPQFVGKLHQNRNIPFFSNAQLKNFLFPLLRTGSFERPIARVSPLWHLPRYRLHRRE